MSAHNYSVPDAPLDLSRWRNVPKYLLLAGGLFLVMGIIAVKAQSGADWGTALVKQFGFSWLLAFMFYLSICLGGLFLVLAHHLFDASWSVPIRRVTEHIACLLPWMAALFVPVAILAPQIYPWMGLLSRGESDHALHAKYPLFTVPMFYVVALICFGIWTLLAYKLRYWSLKQDETGAAECTHQMRVYSAVGIFLFALTLTLAAIMWMKALQHQWFSTMYGVYYFAGSVWLALATVYVITAILKRAGPLRAVVHEEQFYFIGSLLFAFTVFYAYVTFSQYFIIWNANMPEETFWYVVREKGSWWQIGMIIIFGHFFLPFLSLLRIDAKLWLPVMVPICLWAWVMHFCDLSFNIIPVLHPDGFVLHWFDLAGMALIGGVLAIIFLKSFKAHPPYPQKDPRFAEALGVYVPPASSAAAQSHGGGQ
jgi:hypothetical protein